MKTSLSKILTRIAVCGVFATLAVGSSASAIIAIPPSPGMSVDSSGVWDATGGLSNGGTPAGNGTSSIEWGRAARRGGERSGYSFEGESNVDIQLDGGAFRIGTFTHRNFPIYRSSLLRATLAVSVSSAGLFDHTFAFDFAHIETPNRARRCAITGITSGIPCPDVVRLSQVDRVLRLPGMGQQQQDLYLRVFGFSDDGRSFTDTFVTDENRKNSTGLYAELVSRPTAPMPEPGAAMLFGIGGLVLAMRNRRA